MLIFEFMSQKNGRRQNQSIFLQEFVLPNSQQREKLEQRQCLLSSSFLITITILNSIFSQKQHLFSKMHAIHKNKKVLIISGMLLNFSLNKGVCFVLSTYCIKICVLGLKQVLHVQLSLSQKCSNECLTAFQVRSYTTE